MTAALHAELLKLRTVRTSFTVVAAMCALIALVAVAQLFPGSETGQDPATAATQRNIFSAGELADIFAAVMGTLAVTGEYRHRTLSSTFLADPNRVRYVAAKAVSGACLGVVLGLMGAAVTLVAAVAGLRLTGHAVALSWHEIGSTVAWPVARAPGYALIGVAAGLIVRNQAGVLVGLFVWVLVGEAVITGIAPDVGKYLPFAALGSIGGGSISTTAAIGASVAWASALGLAAARLTVTRDVT